jgi:hypothetical protein
MDDSENEWEDEEDYQEYDVEDFAVSTSMTMNFRLMGKGVPAEDRALFERLSGGQSRNLADLITAKLAAHDNRIQFKTTESETEPRQPSFPPKVVEVYKKYASHSFICVLLMRR